MFNYKDINYFMGKERKMGKDDCTYLALAKNILKLDNSKMKEGDPNDEADIEAAAKEFAVKFYRKDGGYISQIRKYLNIDLELIAEDNLDFQCEKYKILYMFYVLKEKYPKVRIIELLGKQSMENIDNTAIGWKTYNGDIVHFVKSMLEKELSKEFIRNVYGLIKIITPVWDRFYDKFNCEVDACISMGEEYDFETLISILKAEPEEVSGEDNLSFAELSPIATLYLRILQNEQIGQVKDIMMVNNIQIKSNYDVPLEMIEEMKALHNIKVEVRGVEEYIEKHVDEIAEYVYLKRDVSEPERRRLLYHREEVPTIYDFCIRVRPLINMQEVSTALFVISCLQAILLGEHNEIFMGAFPGYRKYMHNKPAVRGALKEKGKVAGIVRVYWVRSVLDHWYANLGRSDIRNKEVEVQNLCDNIILQILSCPSMPEMLKLNQLYCKKIM